MNNPPIPDPPASPPETAHAWYIAWRLRLNKYSLRDHKDRLPIVRWAISNQNTNREHSLTYWAEQQLHLQQAGPPYRPRRSRGQQLVEGAIIQSQKHASCGGNYKDRNNTGITRKTG